MNSTKARRRKMASPRNRAKEDPDSASLRPADAERVIARPRSGISAELDWTNLLQVLVRDNNVDQALRVLKKKMQREGVFREMKQRKAYEKPSERKAREKAEAVRRTRKAARKQAQREGLLPAPKRREPVARPGMAPRPPRP